MKDDDELDGILGISGSRASAEAQLLEMVREEESQSFSLSITFSDGKWTVVTEGLEKGTRAIGQGETFTEAWHLQEPWCAPTTSST